MPDVIPPVVPAESVIPAETVPVVATPPPAVVAAPVVRRVENDFEAALIAELAAAEAVIHDTGEAAPAPLVEPAPTETPEPEPVAAPTETEPPAATEEPPTTSEPVEAHAPERIRLTGLPERDRLLADAAIKIARAENIPLAEAMARVSPPKAATPEAVATPDALTEELSAIQTALDEHAAAGDLPSPEIRKMQRREAELLAKQEAQAYAAPLIEKEREREARVFDEARKASTEKAARDFPDAYKDGTPLRSQFSEEVANAQNPAHPDYIPNFVDNPKAPEIALGRAVVKKAQEIADRDNISVGEALLSLKAKPLSAQPVKTAAPIATPPVTAARKPAVTAPGNAATRTPDRGETAEELESKLRAETDPEKIDEILRKSYVATHGSNGRHLARV